MSGSPLAPRSTAGNFSPGRFSVGSGSIPSGSAAGAFGSPVTLRAWTIGSGSPFSSTARSGRPAIASPSPRAAPIMRLRSKALMNSGGSCSASAVIETSTARATHHGAATERAHPNRERPIPEASARALVSRPRAAALRKSAQCEPIPLSALNVAGALPRVRASRPGLGQVPSDQRSGPGFRPGTGRRPRSRRSGFDCRWG